MAADPSDREESLRSQNKRRARERILEAAAHEIVEQGLPGLAVPAVAKRAGVALRTVYNYFETREALIRGIPELLQERAAEDFDQGAELATFDLDQLPVLLPRVWQSFEDLGVLGDAWSVIMADEAVGRGSSTRGTANVELDARFFPAVAALMPEADKQDQEAVARLLRSLTSSESFYRLRHQGVDTQRSAVATGWALRVLVDALRAGDGPDRASRG